ncbi:MAG: flavodoxin domain-containing protein [Candidatus Bathyarchaeota archaeon]|nr:flavodoxin domain-containing protein [Candidatus Bathyarchaeota archaeon]
MNNVNKLIRAVEIILKVLIVYGTRTGTAAITAEDVAKQLRDQGVESRVADAKREKIESVAEYDLIIVWSGIQMGRWTSDADSFLKKYQKEMAGKKVALYVNCGSAVEAMNTNKPGVAEEARKKYLEEKASKYGLSPISFGFFGAIYNFTKMSWIMRKGMESERPRLAAISRETEPGVYDTPDLDGIRNWANELLSKVNMQPFAAAGA